MIGAVERFSGRAGRRRRAAWVALIAVALAGALDVGRVPAAQTPATGARFWADVWSLPDDDRLGFVEVPAGPFLMGSDVTVDRQAFDNERWSEEAAQGTVETGAFLIGRYEVTVAQFRAFVEATGHPARDGVLDAPPDHPVASIAWPDAVAYTRWLEATLDAWPGTPAVIRERLAAGWRITLPSEAEWEKAARGTDGRIYPWGDAPRPDRAHYDATATRPVGAAACPECPYGLVDLSGNVWELTRSPYQPYPYDPRDDASDLDADALFVMRGGSYADPAANVRAAIRGGADPGVRRPFIGFRVVITGAD